MDAREGFGVVGGARVHGAILHVIDESFLGPFWWDSDDDVSDMRMFPLCVNCPDARGGNKRHSLVSASKTGYTQLQFSAHAASRIAGAWRSCCGACSAGHWLGRAGNEVVELLGMVSRGISAAFSPIMIEAALVLPLTISGMTLASATGRFFTP